jgi:hypothetical protein
VPNQETVLTAVRYSQIQYHSLQMDFTEKQRFELGSLSSEFNILVLIVSTFLTPPLLHNYRADCQTKSTFTAALIISFLSFAQIVINNASSMSFQFGLFFSIIAAGFHLFAALVAARAGMICFRISKSLDIQLAAVSAPASQTVEDHSNVNNDRLEPSYRSWYNRQLHTSDFHRFLVLCEQLQLLGTTVYLPSALYLLFYMFERKEFAIVIYAMTGIGAWAVYRLGFWKVSVLWHDLSHAYSRCKETVLGIGESK